MTITEEEINNMTVLELEAVAYRLIKESGMLQSSLKYVEGLIARKEQESETSEVVQREQLIAQKQQESKDKK